MKRLKLQAVFMGFLAVMMAGIVFTSCEQEQMLEVGENPNGLENRTLEQNIISGEFVDHILFFETADFVPHYYVALGISPVAYRLDKKNPATADFIQLIKDAKEGSIIEPLKVTIDKSGKYFTKVVKVSETEERKWRESKKGKIWSKEVVIMDDEEVDSKYRSSKGVVFSNLQAINFAFYLMNTHKCYSSGPSLFGCIPFNYKPDGCYARAHRMKEVLELAYSDKTCDKLFIFSNPGASQMLNAPGCPNTEWLYHVAPYVKAADTGIWYVIDPSIFNQPVTEDVWRAAMGTNNACGTMQTHGSQYSPLQSAIMNCGNGQYSTDNNYTHTYNTLAAFAPLSGC